MHRRHNGGGPKGESEGRYVGSRQSGGDPGPDSTGRLGPGGEGLWPCLPRGLKSRF